MTVLLIDGDALIWPAALTASRSELRADLARRVEGLIAASGARRVLIALSDAENWRKGLWPAYKAHRAARPRPPLLSAARAQLEDGWPSRAAPGLEADDVLGLLATGAPLDDPLDGSLQGSCAARMPRGASDPRPEDEPPGLAALRAERGLAAPAAAAGETRIVFSPDKDLLTVPGLHLRPGGRLLRIPPEEADRRHLALALAGDPSDGYAGAPGIGPRRAARLLAQAGPDPVAQWRAVLGAYEAAGLPAEDALRMARIARVLRRGEIDGSGRPILWRPPE